MLITIISFIDIVLLITVAFSSLWVLRQTCYAHGIYARFFQVAILGLAACSALQINMRFDNYPASIIDLARDGFLGFLFITIILFHKKRFSKL